MEKLVINRQRLIDRFIRYTKINTTSDPNVKTLPSTPGQMELAKLLVQELEQIGLNDISLDEQAIVIATLSKNCTEDVPTIAFIAHLDTARDQPKDTKARVVKNYDGKSIPLNEKLNISLDPVKFPELRNYIDDDIIVTDGTSLLGADDKAAIAEIMEAVTYFFENPNIKHGDIKIVFVPDEEVGLRGASALDVKKLGADFGFTLDGGGIGELCAKNFNAAAASVEFFGVTAHPMEAKGKLKNSILMAKEFIDMLPKDEVPENTQGLEGYNWVCKFAGDVGYTKILMFLRDFVLDGLNARKELLNNLVAKINDKWGEGSAKVTIEDSYRNMEEILNQYPHVLEKVHQAMKMLNITPIVKPIRGGTDGAVLALKGLPTPNIFTGAHNFHSIYEYIPVNSMIKAAQMVVVLSRVCY